MEIIQDCNLTRYNSYNVESKCKRAFFPNTEEDVFEAVTSSKNFILLGSGHNVILSEPYYNSDFIIFNNNFKRIQLNKEYSVLSAEAGASFFDISNIALENSLTGLEFCYDIPSSVGGGVIMNAGTKEGEIRNILLKVRYLDLETKAIVEKDSEDLNLRYRNSVFQNKKNSIILKAWFKLSKGNKAVIYKTMEESKERRWSKQPRDYPNCGSVFKRPPNKFVGPMLDELGLKGYSIGGAQISKKHSGFIINYNKATGKDILELIGYIRAKVKDTFGIDLEIEQRII